MIEMKVCSKCAVEKPDTGEFYNKAFNRAQKFRADCKVCQSLYDKGRRERNNALRREAYLLAPEKRLSYNATWREANPEAYKKGRQASWQRHKEKRAQAKKEWVRENPELRRAIANAYTKRRREAEGAYTPEEFGKVMDEQKGLCFYCSQPMTPPVTDHVTPLSRGGTNWITNIVAACRLCNAFKATQTLEEFRPDLIDAFNLLKSKEI